MFGHDINNCEFPALTNESTYMEVLNNDEGTNILKTNSTNVIDQFNTVQQSHSQGHVSLTADRSRELENQSSVEGKDEGRAGAGGREAEVARVPTSIRSESLTEDREAEAATDTAGRAAEVARPPVDGVAKATQARTDTGGGAAEVARPPGDEIANENKKSSASADTSIAIFDMLTTLGLQDQDWNNIMAVAESAKEKTPTILSQDSLSLSIGINPQKVTDTKSTNSLQSDTIDIQQIETQTTIPETASISSYKSTHEGTREEGEVSDPDEVFHRPDEVLIQSQSPQKTETHNTNTKGKKEIKLTPYRKERTESLQTPPQTYAQAAQSPRKKAESFEIAGNRKRRVTNRTPPDEKSSVYQHSYKSHKTSHEAGT